MTDFVAGDLVYVNGKKGKVVSGNKTSFEVEFENGMKNTYEVEKLIRRHLHCISCNRRLSDKSKKVICNFCSSKKVV